MCAETAAAHSAATKQHERSWSRLFPNSVIVNSVCCCCFTVLLYIFLQHMIVKVLRWPVKWCKSTFLGDDCVALWFPVWWQMKRSLLCSGAVTTIKTLICFSNWTCWILFFNCTTTCCLIWCSACNRSFPQFVFLWVCQSFHVEAPFTPQDHLGWGRTSPCLMYCLPLYLLLSGSHLLTTHWISCCRTVCC